jgi:antibiotic biosynthesis monooxygenase (ABM) superfamily enzyme
MWAQIIKTRMKPGVEQDMAEVRDQMRERVGQRPGLIRSMFMQNQNDPREYYTIIVFESEEQARAGERELDQDPLLQRVRSLGEGTPEYVDLNVIDSLP